MDPEGIAWFREVMLADPPEGMTEAQQQALVPMFRDLWGGPGLTRRERRLVTLTCVAWAITPAPIEMHLYAALQSGELTVEELLEVVLHFAVYCGWPKASNFEMYLRRTWARVQQERGEEPQPLPIRSNDELGLNDWEARLQRGEQEFRDVNLVDAPPRDSPYQHAGILNYVFGHVWLRPGLGRRDRRFVTLACVGLSEAPIPIAAHVGSALRTGDLTKAEVDEVIRHFAAYTRSDPGLAGAMQQAADQAGAEIQAAGS